MAVTAHATGTATGSTTETSLTTVAVAGTFTLHVDTVNMAAGDLLVIRVKQKVLTGGTARTAYFGRYTDAQPTDDLIKISVPISNS